MPDLNQEIADVTQVHPDLLSEAKDVTSQIDRTSDKGIINKDSGSSILARKDGSISLAAGLMSQYRLDPTNGQSVEHSIESNTIAVRKRLEVDEIVINEHKLNPALYELSDMKQIYGYPDTAIGNLTLFATVLVKAWEPTLKKWVLIRRLARMPAFSPILNLPDAPEPLDVDTNISSEILKITERGTKRWQIF